MKAKKSVVHYTCMYPPTQETFFQFETPTNTGGAPCFAGLALNEDYDCFTNKHMTENHHTRIIFDEKEKELNFGIPLSALELVL